MKSLDPRQSGKVRAQTRSQGGFFKEPFVSAVKGALSLERLHPLVLGQAVFWRRPTRGGWYYKYHILSPVQGCAQCCARLEPARPGTINTMNPWLAFTGISLKSWERCVRDISVNRAFLSDGPSSVSGKLLLGGDPPSDMVLFTAILPVRSSVNNGTRSLRVLRTLYERAQEVPLSEDSVSPILPEGEGWRGPIASPLFRPGFL